MKEVSAKNSMYCFPFPRVINKDEVLSAPYREAIPSRCPSSCSPGPGSRAAAVTSNSLVLTRLVVPSALGLQQHAAFGAVTVDSDSPAAGLDAVQLLLVDDDGGSYQCPVASMC